jgi:hypothetical protein
MNGISFYLEYPNSREKRKATRKALGNHSGNVIAILENGTYISGGQAVKDGIAAVYDWPNSPPASTGVSLEFLRERCKRISEATARAIHPQLFEWLDRED